MKSPSGGAAPPDRQVDNVDNVDDADNDPNNEKDADWYEVGTNSPPGDINDDIYTN